MVIYSKRGKVLCLGRGTEAGFLKWLAELFLGVTAVHLIVMCWVLHGSVGDVQVANSSPKDFLLDKVNEVACSCCV